MHDLAGRGARGRKPTVPDAGIEAGGSSYPGELRGRPEGKCLAQSLPYGK